MTSPNNGGLYAHGKMPALDFYCEDLDGNATVASCTATVDANPIANHSALPDSPGAHPVVVTAVDDDGLTRSHTHTYTIKPFGDIYNADSPIAYYRLGDASGDPMKDSSGNGHDGTYKNGQDSGPVGISGDGDHARKFFGDGGYGFVSSIPAPTFQSSLEAWVNPDDMRDQSVAGHGDAGEISIQGGLFVFKHMGTTVTSDVGPAPGHYTQVVGVWDGTTISIYVNGERHGQVEATKRPSSSSTFYVGYGEIRPWFKGKLDEVAYYGRALTPNRILEHFLADPPPVGDEPVFTGPDTPVSNDPADDSPDTGPATGNPPVGSDDGTHGNAAPESGAVVKHKPTKNHSKKRAKKKAKKKAKKRNKASRRGRSTGNLAAKKCRKFKKNKAKFMRCQAKYRKR
ncbi:MAG: LamG domain-containing protein [Solirubrobacterales bacterium]|nr:LamG domain-containing protein [Solirubrobacterales bacterium]